MADLICNMNCIHRSKRPLRKWKRRDGSECYGCSREYIVVDRLSDPDGLIEATAGEENTAVCALYEPVAEAALAGQEGEK